MGEFRAALPSRSRADAASAQTGFVQAQFLIVRAGYGPEAQTPVLPKTGDVGASPVIFRVTTKQWMLGKAEIIEDRISHSQKYLRAYWFDAISVSRNLEAVSI
jgi:hypothetical protein